MLNKLLKKCSLDYKAIKKHQHLKIFGNLLEASYLWSKETSRIANALSIGLFVSMLPIFGHMLLAAALAILLRANLPVAVAAVWFSNPITIPIIYPAGYFLGLKIYGLPVPNILHHDYILTSLIHHWKQFLLGCILAGAGLAFIANISVRLFYKPNYNPKIN